MANGYIVRGTDSNNVVAYALEKNGHYLAHTRRGDEPTDSEGVLSELKREGVPPELIFILSGIQIHELQDAAKRVWGEGVELEHIGVVDEAA